MQKTRKWGGFDHFDKMIADALGDVTDDLDDVGPIEATVMSEVQESEAEVRRAEMRRRC